MVQGVLPVGLDHFIHLACHPAHDGEAELTGIPQEVSAQGATDQGIDPFFPQKLQSLGRLQVRQNQFLGCALLG
jgi:hypothetical protein